MLRKVPVSSSLHDLCKRMKWHSVTLSFAINVFLSRESFDLSKESFDFTACNLLLMIYMFYSLTIKTGLVELKFYSSQ